MPRALGVPALAFVIVATAAAHPLAPSLLEVRETGGGRVAVRWKTPLLRAPGPPATPVLPARCVDIGPHTMAREESALRTEWTIDCPGADLVGERIGVAGLDAAAPPVVVRVVLADGRVAQGVVTAGAPSLTIPAAPRPLDVAWGYARLGVVHILTGPDHLLFVFGLVLLASTLRGVLAAVTAFTLGHSITLTLAALGLVALPIRPIEVAIAASVFVLAVELARDPSARSAIRRRPWVMAVLFGLLHGLGFAAALAEAGLPHGEIPLALLAFNVGIEVGQALFVVVVLALRALCRPLTTRAPGWVLRVPVYVMGSVAALWWIERAAALLR
ncbi:MAG: HupE/UreJ family protein [Candidatus Binatia bacterium]